MVAIDKGVNRVILKTDSLMLKQALDNDSYRLAEAGGLIYQPKPLITGSFSDYQSIFAPRLCNRVAPTLAAKGCLCSQGDDVHWDLTSPWVTNLVASDAVEPLS
jgi:hypothetical protein